MGNAISYVLCYRSIMNEYGYSSGNIIIENTVKDSIDNSIDNSIDDFVDDISKGTIKKIQLQKF